MADLMSSLREPLFRELGIPASLQPEIDPREITLSGNEISLRLVAATPANEYRAAGIAEYEASLPVSAFTGNQRTLEKVFRQTFPLTCRRCGLSHRIGLRNCESSVDCWGRLTWRKEAPPPRYYIESGTGYGYYEGTKARKVRFVYDFERMELIHLQVTIRMTERWIEPREFAMPLIEQKIGPVLKVLSGKKYKNPLELLDTAHLSFSLPEFMMPAGTVDEEEGQGTEHRIVRRVLLKSESGELIEPFLL
jgi:hypothetical protein